MAAGEDIVLMVAGVVMIMLGVVFEDDGYWGRLIGLMLLAAGFAWPYLRPLMF